MGSRTLTPESAAAAILEADPLTDVRISLGYQTTGGVRRAVLRLSSKSTVNYKEKAKPLGTLPAVGNQNHTMLLTDLVYMMEQWQRRKWCETCRD